MTLAAIEKQPSTLSDSQKDELIVQALRTIDRYRVDFNEVCLVIIKSGFRPAKDYTDFKNMHLEFIRKVVEAMQKSIQSGESSVV